MVLIRLLRNHPQNIAAPSSHLVRRSCCASGQFRQLPGAAFRGQTGQDFNCLRRLLQNAPCGVFCKSLICVSPIFPMYGAIFPVNFAIEEKTP